MHTTENISRLVVTGGAGFIGSSFVRTMLQDHPDLSIAVVDSLTYAGNLENLAEVAELPRFLFIRADIRDRPAICDAFEAAQERFGGPIDAVAHFAAETHVDRSILDPVPFLQTNVLGTEVMLSVSRARGVRRFVHVSTDEVYGSLTADAPAFTEQSHLAPNNPYSASKAGSDLIARSYFETYGFPVITTRCSNNYGPYQFPEKLIPLIIANASNDIPLPIYGDGSNVRDWIYADDHSRGIDAVLRRGRPGGVYNLGGSCEKSNLEVVKTILRYVGKPESLIRFVTDRPGHDRRYAMDTTLAETELGWRPQVSFDEGIRSTVDWYLGNREWVENVRSGAYRQYYEQMYGSRTYSESLS
jgi:dTDP-glucose 4,6-dehydratase